MISQATTHNRISRHNSILLVLASTRERVLREGRRVVIGTVVSFCASAIDLLDRIGIRPNTPTVCFTIATGHNFVNLSPPRIPGRFPIFFEIKVATNETKLFLDFQVSLLLAGKRRYVYNRGYLQITFTLAFPLKVITNFLTNFCACRTLLRYRFPYLEYSSRLSRISAEIRKIL
jgi:hypothetical protein